MTWARVFAGYDDEALAALANPGLLRRARKELASGAIRAQVCESGAVLEFATATVRVDGRGPTAVVCPCPAAGVCIHVVAACLWTREYATTGAGPAGGDPAGGATGGQPGEPSPTDAAEPATSPPGEAVDAAQQLDPLADLLGADSAVVNKAAGVAAVRRVARTVPADWRSGAVTHVTAPDACTTTIEGQRLTITWPGGSVVHHICGAAPAAMLIEGPALASAAAAAVRLEAIIRVFARAGVPWPLPTPATNPDLTAGQLHTIEDTREGLVDILDAGLSHLGRDSVALIQGVAAAARVEGLPLLHGLLLTAAGVLDRLVKRDDSLREEECLSAIARAWALTEAIRAAPVDRLPSLLGSTRQATAGAEAVVMGPRFTPLGARLWYSPSGARGATLTVWDSAEGRTRRVTAARAAGQDPGFRPSWDSPVWWGRAPSSLCSAPFDLDGAASRADGSLANSDKTVARPTAAFSVPGLAAIAERMSANSRVSAVGFAPVEPAAVLIVVRDVGALGLDEIRQELTWSLVDAGGAQHELRLPVSSGGDAEGLLAIVATRRRVVAVTAERSGDLLMPVGVFWQAPGGGIELVSPSMTHIRGTYTLRGLRGRIAALRQRASERSVGVPVVARVHPVVGVCRPGIDVAEALATTGARQATALQRERLANACRTATDLGLATVAAQLGALAEPEVGPEDLMTAQFVLERAVALAS